MADTEGWVRTSKYIIGSGQEVGVERHKVTDNTKQIPLGRESFPTTSIVIKTRTKGIFSHDKPTSTV